MSNMINKRLNENMFWARVRRTDHCWFWKGSVNQGGYGVHGTILAHRAAWLITRGTAGFNQKVLHTCDNRRCVNPNHLYLGSQADNVKDMMDRKRAIHHKGEGNHRAKLTEQQVLEIRDLCKSGTTKTHIAAKYGVTPTLVGSIAKRRIWTHV